MHFERQKHMDRGLDLERVLVWFRKREVSNLRDKVYGFLGLIRGAGDTLLQPDYNLSVAEVYMGTMKHMILQTGHLDILDACIPSNKIPGLPSGFLTGLKNLMSGPPVSHSVATLHLGKKMSRSLGGFTLHTVV
jgi:hypothetical protein